MPESKKVNKIERIVSFCILVCLAVVAAGVYFKQFVYDSRVFDSESATTGSANSAAAGLEQIVPAKYKSQGNPESFNKDNLYEKIDGKADLYLEHGFGGLSCVQFGQAEKAESWVEFYAYDMGTPRNAFAVYSQQKRPDAVDVNVCELAYRTADSVFLCKGKYYCEIVGSGGGEEVVGGMLESAAKFVAKFGQGAGQLEELAVFPKENLVAGSFKYYPSGAYGFADFNNVFAATYKVGGAEVRAFTAKMENGEKANLMAGAYKKFLLDNGGKAAVSSNAELQGAMINMDGSFEAVFAKGDFVAGVHEAESQQVAEALAGMLIKQLK